MTNEKRIAFVINPISGPKKKEQVAKVIEETMSGLIPYDVLVWQEKNNFKAIQDKITSGNYTHVVAVGGDGTVNEVAKNLVNTGIVLGIIPRGSGNGLARSLGIPMDLKAAIRRVETGQVMTIDNGFINGRFFSCTAGIGFDAHIGKLFDGSKKRGLFSYVKISISELISYKSKEYTLSINEQIYKTKAFLITFANAGQYGNDFYIAPQAKLNDGLLDLVIVKPFNFIGACNLLVKVLMRKANLSKNVVTFRAESFKVLQIDKSAIHYDGEPEQIENEIEVRVNPGSLKVIC